MTFLDVLEGVEYESAIIPKLSFLKGGGSVDRQPGKSLLFICIGFDLSSIGVGLKHTIDGKP